MKNKMKRRKVGKGF